MRCLFWKEPSGTSGYSCHWERKGGKYCFTSRGKALNSASNHFQVEKVLSQITVNEVEICDSIGNDASRKNGKKEMITDYWLLTN